MRRHQWTDAEGFGRPVEVQEAIYSVIGPDNLDHAVRCEFITERGILPCSCDQTRTRISNRPDLVGKSWWWKCWFRWQEVRCQNSPRPDRLPWPVSGPDGDPWVPGIDFNDGRDDDDI